MDGGAGYDAAAYDGLLGTHLLDVDVGAQQISVTDRQGHVDIIANVEALTFADGVVRLGDLSVVPAQWPGQARVNCSLAARAWIAFSPNPGMTS